MNKITNPCILCGKQRVVVKEYKVVVEKTTLTHIETVCPDPECQKKLEKQLEQEKLKRQSMYSEKTGYGFQKRGGRKKGSLHSL